ncbi:MAG TPA: hypothetical protein VFW86_05935 [Candidatus Limnocylindrales bacterium]|jgi:hypothetical protein|nr:hypothetical protein [Candidatus Limnocylindrales bacterium]
MHRIARTLVLAVVAAALVAGTALAAPGGTRVLDARLAAEPAAAVNEVLFGVQAGGLPWRIDRGSVQLSADGRLHVVVQGLVLDAGPAAGTNPIPSGQAILTCAGMPAASSSVVPFSTSGDATVNERVDLPASCLAPAVFFAGVPAPGVARWFAVTGW